MTKEEKCINADGHRFATVKQNEDGSFDVYCKECGVERKSEVAH